MLVGIRNDRVVGYLATGANMDTLMTNYSSAVVQERSLAYSKRRSAIHVYLDAGRKDANGCLQAATISNARERTAAQAHNELFRCEVASYPGPSHQIG